MWERSGKCDTRTPFERKYGMVELSPLEGMSEGSQFGVTSARAPGQSGDETVLRKDTASQHPSRAFAEAYLDPVLRSVLTSEQFMRWSERHNRTEEANLWSLLLELLLDAEEAAKYDPDAIGIAEVQPHRQWYISHQAHIQDLLQRHPMLRRMNIILRWLEQVYRHGSVPLKLSASRSPEEATLLRQIILSYLRGGELHRAIDVAVTARDCTYSCLLSAAQMQTVVEPWFNVAPLVPLFGEYGSGEVDRDWACNEHRLDNLSQLYEDSVTLSASSEGRTAIGGLDALIAAVLCGNLEVMEPAFLVSGSWRDVVWCHLRSALVLCFTKTLMTAHHIVQAPYGTFVERLTGSHDCWQDEIALVVVKRLSERLQSTYLPSASLEEKLQMRVILQFLSPGSVDWLNVTDDLEQCNSVGGGCDGVRLISHLLLCLDVAYCEALHSHSVQVHSSSLVDALARYAGGLVQLPHYPPEDAMKVVIAMTLRLRSARQRAKVYTAFLIACRRRELQLAKREEVEALEERLVRRLCDSDPVSEVHDEVMRLLNQTVEPGALLTHNPLAEAVMWRAMHADSHDDYVAALQHALQACSSFWLAEPHAELDAITDVAGILRRTVLPKLQRGEVSSSDAPSDMEVSEAHFWITFAEMRMLSDHHAKATAQLDVVLGGADRTLEFQLAQEEAALMSELLGSVCKAVTYGGAVVHRSRSCITAVTWLLQVFVEEAILSVRLAAPTSPVIADYLRQVFALIEEIDALGYVEPSLMPRQSAQNLFTAVRLLRVACGQKAHDRVVEEMRKTTTGHQQLFANSSQRL